VLVALGDLVDRLQLFVVGVLDAEGAADVVHTVLVGRRIVSAGRFVADGVRVFPVGIHVAAGQLRAGVGAFLFGVEEGGPAGACRRRMDAIRIERGRRARDGLVDLAQALALALERRHPPRVTGPGRRARGPLGRHRIGAPADRASGFRRLRQG
jgi:hypothetical protein